MFLAFFGLWVVLNGRWTTEIAVFGLVFAAVMYVFSCKFLGYGLGVDWALIRRLPSAIRYGALLLSEIVKANLNVMRMILDKRFEPQPQLVHFDAPLRRGRHLVTLANSITLTPGTITVDLQDNHYVVHCLDASLIDGLDDGEMVQALEAMERAHEKQAQEAPATPDETPAADDAQAATPDEAPAADDAQEAATPDETPAADDAQEAPEADGEYSAQQACGEAEEDEH